MKKIFALLLTLLLVLSLTACKKDVPTEDVLTESEDPIVAAPDVVDLESKPNENAEPADTIDSADKATEPKADTVKPEQSTPAMSNTSGNSGSNGTTDKPAHTHSYTSKVVAPTCTADGYTLYTCSCGDTYKDNAKAKLGHNYSSKVIVPTATAQGYTLHTCSRCGSSYKDDYKPATGGNTEQKHTHSYTVKTVAPTCTADGYTLHTCSCGDSYKDNTVKKLGHSYSDKVIAPTATAKGYTLHTCSRCGSSYKDNYKDAIPAHTHNYAVSDSKAATCTTDGYTVYTCSCGGSYTKTQSKLGHDWKEVWKEVPKYVMVEHTKCAECGAILDDMTQAEEDAHIEAHVLAGGSSRTYTSAYQEQVGTENQIVGYQCTICGEWK